MKEEKFSWAARARSFYHAFAGIRKFVVSEHNALIHLGATVAVIIGAFLFRVSATEAIEITLAVGLVWVAEMFNTCIEKLTDLVTREKNPAIGLIKDIAAGSVLVASAMALVTGLFIFIPKLL
jgi:diacylglycerol kinase (ATP)